MDVGNVRHWPGISRQELVSLFPNGKTLHVPSDGRPLPGYEQAVAAYQARKGAGTPNIELASAGGSTKRSGGLLAALFGGGADEADDEADTGNGGAAPQAKAVKQVQVATAAPARNLPGIAIVAPKDAKRANVPQIADDSADDSQQQDTPETIIAALPPKEIPLPGFAPRPKVDVGQQTPQNVPFATADASATTEQAVATAQTPTPDKVPFGTASAAEAVSTDPAQVAVNNVPLPTWRPDRSTPAEPAPKDKNVLLALAETASQDKSATDAFSVLPTARPQPGKQDEVKAVLEQANATVEAGGAGAEYQLASLTEPERRSAFNDPSGVDAASPRQAIAALPAGADPAQAIGAGVKTTRKEARASAHDMKPGPKALVVAPPPQAARWALGSGVNIASVSDPTTAPRYAYNIVHTPPSEVYTAGFQADGQVPDASRFTGNAVKFLSVARFQTK
jgi:hypothetical protein